MSQSRGVVGFCARVAEEKWFHGVSAGVILLNAVILGVETYPRAVAQFGGALHVVDSLCLAFFTLEVAIRLTACGRRPMEYFRSPWNVFDLLIVVSAMIPGVRENVTLLRLFRLARVLRVIRIFPTMRIIVHAVWRSIPGTTSLAVLGVILLYVYGMLAWMLFGAQLPEKYGSIGRATLSMFYLMLFDDLSGTISEGMALSRWTLLFFISFVLLGGFLMVNILLGVVLSSLDEARVIESEDDANHAAAAHAAAPAGASGASGAEPAQLGEPVSARIAALKHAIGELEAELHRGLPVPEPREGEGSHGRAGVGVG
ncbi:voltage-gated sodium channel [Allocatelliglobosispora scoriae]|uniref:Voltage-gated sodium channel n=1 Tax=Allocatelliglobosispora scoriae TaxID=643052 RepID=A0A841BPW2_9ACTN|nr:ion transporter [Allocatelliglobosispora scoriae]MBB5868871.1 voltage-gated sodium channel [Allocatelliglobosispora scoriae]